MSGSFDRIAVQTRQPITKYSSKENKNKLQVFYCTTIFNRLQYAVFSNSGKVSEFHEHHCVTLGQLTLQ